MYRIKNDKRILKSADKLKDGLLACMKKKAFNDISVSDIAHESGVCRATFYRIFDTPIDVLSYACDSYAHYVRSQVKGGAVKDKDSFIRFMLTSWLEHADVIDAIMKSGRPLVLHKSLQIIFNDIFFYGSQFTDDEKDYIQSAVAAQFASILFVWIQHGRKESVGYLVRLFKRFTLVASTNPR